MQHSVFLLGVCEELNKCARVKCGCWQCVSESVLSPVSVVIYFSREVAHIEEFESHPQRHLKAALQPVVHTVLLRLKTSQPRGETRGFVKSSSGSVFFFNGWHVDGGQRERGLTTTSHYELCPLRGRHTSRTGQGAV